MTHISKQKLSKEKEGELYAQLFRVIARLNKTTAPDFLSELFGEEEKLMFAKRLAAIILYIEGSSSYRVWTLLNMSPSTADRIRLNFQVGKYRNIQSFITKNRSEYARLLRTLEVILQAGLPPRGRGRWNLVTKLLTEK